MPEVILAVLGVLTAVLSVVSAVLAVLLKAESDRRHELARQVYENKRTAYGQFSDLINSLLTSTTAKNPTPKYLEKLTSDLLAIRKEIWTYASPNVVTVYSAFQQLSYHPVENKSVVIALVARLLLAMRLDMGLSNQGIDELSILRIFITDIDSTYPQTAEDTNAFLKVLRSVRRPRIK